MILLKNECNSKRMDDKINEYIPMCPIGFSLGYMSSNNEMIQLKVYHK